MNIEETLKPYTDTQTHLPSYNRPVNAFQCVTDADRAKWLRRNGYGAPHMAELFAEAAERLNAEYRAELDAAFVAHFGRPMQFGDYKISGIGRDEFSIETKQRLRTLVQAASKCRYLAEGYKYLERYYR